MPKLRLKRTPAEEALHQWRKSSKGSPSGSTSSSNKRRRDASMGEDDFSDDIEYGPPPPPPASSSRRHQLDYDDIRARIEEERFREKMWGAYGEDERLDSIEARLNDFVHVPKRWRDDHHGKGKASFDDDMVVDPQYMDDDEYVEWVRAAMWRKQHALELESQRQQQAARTAQRAREKAIKAETARLEKAAEDEWKRLKSEKESKRIDEARDVYDRRWHELLDRGDRNPTKTNSEQPLTFGHIPWPILSAHTRSKRHSKVVSLCDLTEDAISKFLLPSQESTTSMSGKREKKERKERLRETMLRFHPDKFEGRVMGKVAESDKEMAREGVGIVVRAVAGLMGDGY